MIEDPDRIARRRPRHAVSPDDDAAMDDRRGGGRFRRAGRAESISPGPGAASGREFLRTRLMNDRWHRSAGAG
jgi:hypothetical protein